MAFKFNAILDFNSERAKKGMKTASKGFNQMKNAARQAGESMSKINQGLQGLTAATAPLAAGTAAATKTFADFEKQMSVVKSLTRGVTDEEFQAMQAEAKRLGATTSFSARRAAEGLQFLALAGFDAQEQVGGLENVLRLAEAGSLDLKSASDIATDSVSALGASFDENVSKTERLSRITDKFAFIQSKTNTNVQQLGNAITFGGQALANFGLQTDEVIAAMGAVADSGLKASKGGTALANMFTKLLKPSGKAEEVMDELGISIGEISDEQGNLLPLPELVDKLGTTFENIDKSTERGQKAIRVFGRRGIRAFAALSEAGPERLSSLMGGLATSTGEATRQAEARLDNLSGAFTKLLSATEGVSIEIGSIIGGFIREPVERAAKALSGVAIAFQLVTGQIEESSKSGKQFFEIFGEDRGEEVLAFVEGFIDGLKEVKEQALAAFNSFKEALEPVIGNTDTSTENIGKMVAKVITFGAVAAPVLAAVVAGLFVMSSAVTVVSGAVGLLGSVFSFVGGAMTTGLGIVNTLLGTQITFMGILSSVWGVLGTVASAVFSPVVGIVAAVVAAITALAGGIANVIQKWDQIKQAFQDEGIIEGIKEIGSVFLSGMLEPFEFVFNKIGDMISGLSDFILDQLKGLATSALGGVVDSVKGFFTGGDAEQEQEVKVREQRQIESVASDFTPRLDRARQAAQQSPGVPTEEALRLGGIPDDLVGKLAKQIDEEGQENRSQIQPPSAEEQADAIAARMGQQPQQTGTQNLNISVTGKLVGKGKDLNAVITKEQVSQREANGRPMNPRSKQKSLRNGAQAMGN